MATSPLTLYHGAPTRSARIFIALDELGKLSAAEIKSVEFLKGEHLKPEHTAVSKGWNTLPVLIIGEDTVLESGAALQLVLERFDKEGQLQVPVDAKERATYLYWLWFAEATLSQAIVSFLYHVMLLPEDQRDPKSAERYKKTVFKCFDAIEAQLSDGRTWITGDKFTAADITLLHGLFLTIAFAKIADKEAYPKTTAFFERITARESVKKAYSPLLD